jgi:serine/threonine protein kinase
MRAREREAAGAPTTSERENRNTLHGATTAEPMDSFFARAEEKAAELKKAASAKAAELMVLADEKRKAASAYAKDKMEHAEESRREKVVVNGVSLTLMKQVAEGGYGFVYVARRTPTEGGPPSSELYALKKMICGDAESAAMAQNEIEVMRTLGEHPHIVRLLEHSSNRGPRAILFVLVMELMKGGSLARHVVPTAPGGPMPPRLSEATLLRNLLDTAQGAAHMHACGLIHYDLKLENVLETERGVCKLCDFGSTSGRSFDAATAGKRERTDEEDRISKFSTLMNRAPEMVDLHRGQRIGPPVDVWALGCMLYTLGFRRHPFDGGLGEVTVRREHGLHSISARFT